VKTDLIRRIHNFIISYERDIYSTDDQEFEYLEQAINLLKEIRQHESK
jgi:hypothetical protein